MLGYGIPVPPMLPTDLKADEYFARLNHVSNQFDVHRCQSGLGYLQLDHAQKDPVYASTQLKLGPPSLAPDWHPLLEKWGLQVLAAAGFINSTAYRGFEGPQLPFGRLGGAFDGLPIHPVLREDMWVGLQPGEYKLMEPAIRLASAILDDPDTLRFYAGLTTPSSQMPWTFFSHIGRVPFFRASDPLDRVELKATYTKVVNMRHYMAWSMQEMDHMLTEFGCLGLTQQWRRSDGTLAPGARGLVTRSSVIYISRGYTEAMRMYFYKDPSQISLGRYVDDTQYLAGVPFKDTVYLEEESAMCRSTMLFADTLIHEFTHALNSAYFDRSAMQDVRTPVSGGYVYEPFFEGDRSNEVGHAVSSYIFRGNPRPVFHWNIPQSCSSLDLQQHIRPLGLYWQKWDRWCVDTGFSSTGASRTLDDPDPDSLERQYPVPQAHVNKLFSRTLWTDEIFRFGLEAVRMPKLDAWAADWGLSGTVTIGHWGTGGDRYNMAPVPIACDDEDDEGVSIEDGGVAIDAGSLQDYERGVPI